MPDTMVKVQTGQGSLSQMFERIAGEMKDLEQQQRLATPQKVRGTYDEQVAALSALLTANEIHHKLKVGDIVKHKPGLGDLNEAKRDQVALLFWRRLDATNPADQALIESWVSEHNLGDAPDCIVANICEDGECLFLRPCRESTLEPATV